MFRGHIGFHGGLQFVKNSRIGLGVVVYIFHFGQILFKFAEVFMEHLSECGEDIFLCGFSACGVFEESGLVQAEYHSEEVGFIASLGI